MTCCLLVPKIISNPFSNLGVIGEKCVPSTSWNDMLALLLFLNNSAEYAVLSSTVDILFSRVSFSFSPRSMQILFTERDKVFSLNQLVNPSYHKDPEIQMMFVKALVLNPAQTENNPDNETPRMVLSASLIPNDFSTLGMISFVRVLRKIAAFPPKGFAFLNTPSAGHGEMSSFQLMLLIITMETPYFSDNYSQSAYNSPLIPSGRIM